MKRAALLTVLTTLCSLGITGCGSSSKALTVTITGAPSTMTVAMTANVAAVVGHDPSLSGVRWTCAPASVCGTTSFYPPTSLSGQMTVFTAPAALPDGGQVTITATSVKNPNISNSANITITATTVNTNNFTFYVTGEEVTEQPYCIAGVIAIATDGSGTVIAGEQDYNDGTEFTSPQPLGDIITGGSLEMDASTGLGTLTLTTNNIFLGVYGTETFAIAFANGNHALITQFDGTATSSGSLDLQTSTATPSGAFSFVASGIGISGEPVADGGVIAIDDSGNLTGIVDVNDGGTVTLATPISDGAALTATDSLGRGAITGGGGIALAANFYVVGPEVIRLIDVDTTDTAVGSAYGQGAGNFGPASIGQSAFLFGSSPDGYAAAGQFTTDPGSGSFSGVGDLNEFYNGVLLPAQPFDDTYAMDSNGYGALNFTSADFGDVASVGIYAVDPTLNILDPNDTGTSTGGALMAEMDANLVGTGQLIPQTDTLPGHFRGAYTFGAQGRTDATDDEFDFIGEGTVTDHNFVGTGFLSDPLAALTGMAVESSTATFTGSIGNSNGNPGRLPLSLTVASSATPPDFASVSLDVTTYQANGGLLFWIDMDEDQDDYFGGSLEQNTLP